MAGYEDYDSGESSDEYSSEYPDCEPLAANFYLFSYWWVTIIAQILSFFLFAILWGFLSRSFPCLEKQEDVMPMLYFQASFWTWMIYLILGASCQIWAGEPLMVTGIIFASILYIFSLFGTFGSKQDKGLGHKLTMKEFQEYFEAARQLPPQIQISGRAYHMESYRNREGKLRTKEVDTFHASEDYKFDAWLDYSEYPDVPAVSTNNMIQASFVFKQEAGDSYTKADLEKFFKDFKSWIKEKDTSTDFNKHQVAMTHRSTGPEAKTVEYLKSKEKNPTLPEESVALQENDFAEIEEIWNEPEHHFVCLITPEKDVSLPWYMNSCILGLFNMVALSAILRFFIANRITNKNFTIKKEFFADPKKPPKSYCFNQQQSGGWWPQVLGGGGGPQEKGTTLEGREVLVSHFSDVSSKAECNFDCSPPTKVASMPPPVVLELPVGGQIPTAPTAP